MTKDFAVSAGRLVTVTWSTDRKSTRISVGVIVIGGSLAETGETLISGIRENIYSRSLPLATANLRVTAVSTPNAALKGAATMVLQQLLA